LAERGQKGYSLRRVKDNGLPIIGHPRIGILSPR